MKLYESLANWWPLLSPPEEYAEEAAFYAKELIRAGDQPARTLVEFGSGGGNNAWHLKRQFAMTLVDAAPGMLAVSQDLNPDCEHLEGDMRTSRLGREFDRVLIHDAICYMTTLEDLQRAVETAFVHCRPGGAVLLAPDFTRETFIAESEHGGSDGKERGLRYLAWTCDPDPDDTTYVVDYAYMLREKDGSVSVEHDRHVEGLFRRAEWLAVLTCAGFHAEDVPFEHSEVDRPLEVFVGVKPAYAPTSTS